MPFGWNFLGYASAEKIPVKRYNYLVGQLYPPDEPDPWTPLEPGVVRAVSKLRDYLESSEHRIPKVSRRLARRLYKQVTHRRLGYARVTVDAYVSVLDLAGPARSYALANELVSRSVVSSRVALSSCACAPGAPSRAPGPSGSAVGLLLSDDDPGFRALGARLFAAFLDVLDGADAARDVDALVPLLATDAASGGGRAVDARSAEASLRALRADADFRARLALPAPHAPKLAVAALRRLARDAGSTLGRGDAGTGAAVSHSAADAPGPNALASTAPAVAADAVAVSLVRDLLAGPGGGPTLTACLDYFDRDGRWLRPEAASAREAAFPDAFGPAAGDDAGRGGAESGPGPSSDALHVLGVLVRHVGAGGGDARPGDSAAHGAGAGLPPAERAAVLDGAAQATARLSPGLVPAALMGALRALDDDVEDEIAAARATAPPAEHVDTMAVSAGPRRPPDGTPATEAALRLVRALCRRAADSRSILRGVTDALRAGGVGGLGAPGTGALARSALRAALRREDPVPADRVDAALVGLADALRVLGAQRREAAQRATALLLALSTDPPQLGAPSADALGASLALEASLPDATRGSLDAARASLDAARPRLPPLAFERAAAAGHPVSSRRGTGGEESGRGPGDPATQAHATSSRRGVGRAEDARGDEDASVRSEARAPPHTAAAAARAGARLPPESDLGRFSEAGSVATSTSPAEARASRLRALYRNLPADGSDASLALFLGGGGESGAAAGGDLDAIEEDVPAPSVEDVLATLRRATDVLVSVAA